jgi:predicted Fe-Mo cluster-binding NifX family protein
MRIAVTATGHSPSSHVDPRFGRAAWFIVYETSDGSFEVIDNGSGQAAAQGAGIQAAETLSRLGVSALLTGHCGPNAFQALKAAGIKVHAGMDGTVADAIERFRSGTLQPAGGADVGGHWT